MHRELLGLRRGYQMVCAQETHGVVLGTTCLQNEFRESVDGGAVLSDYVRAGGGIAFISAALFGNFTP
eukprot:7301131-Pyramimonas_sp.AAC.1